MKIINDILYIEWLELINSGISENTIKSARLRKYKNWIFIKDPDDDRKVLVEYEKLNALYKEQIISKFGNPYNIIARQPIKDLIKWDLEAEKFYLNYRFDSIKSLSTEHVKKYTTAANWLNMLKEMNEDKRAFKKRLNLNIIDFYMHVSGIIKDENISLPANHRKLLAKQKEYNEKGYQCLISWKFGNKSAAKIKDELAESVLLEMIAHHNQYDDVFIQQQYNKWAISNEYPQITSATVGVHRRKNEHLIIQPREGNASLNEKYLKQVKGFRPTAPLYMIESDDNHIDLQFIDLDTGNKFARYKAIVVIDSFNDYVLGYAYTTNDVTIELVKSAYHNAMYYIRSITGGWYIPHELKTDNFGIATLQPWYQGIGNFIQTPVGSKHRGYIEQFFGSANWKRCLKIGANNYTGNNMTAKTRGVNMEVVQANISSRPVLGNESEMQVEQFFHRLRHMPNNKGISKHQQWINAWSTLPDNKKRLFTDEQFLLQFGIEHNYREEGIRISNRGVEPIINGIKYSYDLQEYHLEHIGKSVSIFYDPADMSRVLLTNHNDLRILAHDARLQSRSLADTHIDSRRYLNSILSEKKEAVGKVGRAESRRKEVLKPYMIDAEAVLQSGVVTKELKMQAEQKFLEDENTTSKTSSILDQL